MHSRTIRHRELGRRPAWAGFPRTTCGLLVCAAAVLCVAALGGCGRAWQVTIIRPDGSPFEVSKDVLVQAREASGQEEETESVAVDRVLAAAGHQAVERLIVIDTEGTRHDVEWAAAADVAQWLPDGSLDIGGLTIEAARLEVAPPALLGQATGQVQASITDLAPTAAAALGLPAPSQATGRALDAPQADHVLLLFVDGLGYIRYGEALRDGLIPNLAALGTPYIGLTVYPPSTNVATAALLSGAPPAVNGVTGRGMRQTSAETLFDVASAAGRRVVAVEGESLPFNLRGAEPQLSGDRDGNDSTDDNVLANALAVLAGGMPDVLLVHLHGIDDAGHTYGPGTAEESARVRVVDAAIGQIVAAAPPGTLVLIFADHGQHRVETEERLGNHGTLLERDMFIPIWIITR